MPCWLCYVGECNARQQLSLTLGGISDAEAQPLALPMPEVMPAGSLIIIQPNETKIVKGRRSRPFHLGLDADSKHCFLSRLPAYLNQRLAADAPSDSFLFSPLTSNKQSFKNSRLSASDIGKRIKHHLQQACLYAGESCHGSCVAKCSLWLQLACAMQT